MNIAIIGAGFTGLSAGYYVSKQGHHVTIFEKDTKPGGLAVGFRKKEWDWTFEEHYHHWFSNDEDVLSLARDIDFPVLLKRPKTSVYVDGAIYQLDSPRHVLSFPRLSLLEKVRMAGVLATLKFNPFWQPLEKIHAHTFLKSAMGERAYEMLWEPQLFNKFGSYYTDLSLAWFWARIAKRTPKLAYPAGGYLKFAEQLVHKIEKEGGEFMFGSNVKSIESGKNVRIIADKPYSFDALIFTGSSGLFSKLTQGLSPTYIKSLTSLKSLGAMNLVLRLRRQFMVDSTYWLSVCDKDAPIMAIVEHTNFMNGAHFNNEHLVYVGNYLPVDDKRFSMNTKEILKLYDPFLIKINMNYKKNLIGAELFKAPFAQPIVPVNYSALVPSIKTPLPNIYLANMQQVYPWDRGTNYAVELGKRVANAIIKKRVGE